MFWCRNGKFRSLTQCFIPDQRRVIVFHNQRLKCFIHFSCPVITRLGEFPVHNAQVVNHIPTADDQYTLLTKSRQFFSELIMKLWTFCVINAELQHGNFRFREHSPYHRPSAMIKAPFMIQANFGLVNHGRSFFGKGRRARARASRSATASGRTSPA